MKFQRLITAIDAHVEGMPIRLITGGVPHVRGKTMTDKRDFFKHHLDYLRTCLVCEPRGHINMTACLLTEPVTEQGAFGAIFMSPRGYIDICGHGSMGVAVIALETGLIKLMEPVTDLFLDTPAGAVRVRVNITNGKARSATLENVPAFFYGTKLIEVPGIGKVRVDLAYGGANCAIFEAKALGIQIRAHEIMKSQDLLVQVREVLSEQVTVQHPELHTKQGIEAVILVDKPINPEANVRITNVGLSGRVDRSPCGAGTSARLAAQYFKKELTLGETFVTESIVGTTFQSKAVREINVGRMKAIVPEITGRVFTTGIHHFLIEERDPFGYGFQI